jgi:hypothetical protein
MHGFEFQIATLLEEAVRLEALYLALDAQAENETDFLKYTEIIKTMDQVLTDLEQFLMAVEVLQNSTPSTSLPES